MRWTSANSTSGMTVETNSLTPFAAIRPLIRRSGASGYNDTQMVSSVGLGCCVLFIISVAFVHLCAKFSISQWHAGLLRLRPSHRSFRTSQNTLRSIQNSKFGNEVGLCLLGLALGHLGHERFLRIEIVNRSLGSHVLAGVLELMEYRVRVEERLLRRQKNTRRIQHGSMLIKDTERARYLYYILADI